MLATGDLTPRTQRAKTGTSPIKVFGENSLDLLFTSNGASNVEDLASSRDCPPSLLRNSSYDAAVLDALAEVIGEGLKPLTVR
jgi:hypothetical protein